MTSDTRGGTRSLVPSLALLALGAGVTCGSVAMDLAPAWFATRWVELRGQFDGPIIAGPALLALGCALLLSRRSRRAAAWLLVLSSVAINLLMLVPLESVHAGLGFGMAQRSSRDLPAFAACSPNPQIRRRAPWVALRPQWQGSRVRLVVPPGEVAYLLDSRHGSWVGAAVFALTDVDSVATEAGGGSRVAAIEVEGKEGTATVRIEALQP